MASLKCVRLEKIDNFIDLNSSKVRRSRFEPGIGNKNQTREEEEKKHNRDIHIPKIEEMF
jgi:hypothetical protein